MEKIAMSDTKAKKSTKKKSTKKSTKDSPSSAKSSDSGDSSDSTDSAASSSSDDSGSSESSATENTSGPTYGATDVYYGKFSNVKNPAYRGGWDDIWGSGDSPKQAPAKKKPARKKAAPFALMLDMDDMPEDLRAGLADFAKAELKRQKSRANYDKRDKAGSVSWRIECRIES